MNRILDELGLEVERSVVLNKADLTDKATLCDLQKRYDAFSVSSVSGAGLDALKAHLAKLIEGPDHVPLPNDEHAAYGVVNAASYD